MSIPDEVSQQRSDFEALIGGVRNHAVETLDKECREMAARTLEEAASEHFRQSLAAGHGDPAAVAEWLRERAASIREGSK